MDMSLLITKVRIPSPPHRAVQRDRLIDILERGIRQYKLLLLSAPAGYGKTTLLSQWAHASRFPVAWLSIDAADNDLERFFRYLLAAWEQVQPGIRESPLGLLLGGMLPDSQAVLAAFVNVANDVPDHLVFVLDDYQLVEEPLIQVGLTLCPWTTDASGFVITSSLLIFSRKSFTVATPMRSPISIAEQYGGIWRMTCRSRLLITRLSGMTLIS